MRRNALPSTSSVRAVLRATTFDLPVVMSRHPLRCRPVPLRRQPTGGRSDGRNGTDQARVHYPAHLHAGHVQLSNAVIATQFLTESVAIFTLFTADSQLAPQSLHAHSAGLTSASSPSPSFHLLSGPPESL